MPARRFALGCALLLPSLTLAADPAAERAMTAATNALDGNRPAEAVTALEAALSTADGDPAFLALLARSYRDEMTKQKLARTPDPARLADLQNKLALLTERATVRKQMPDLVSQATDLFRQATADPQKFAAAAGLYAKAVTSKVELSDSQKAAWAYCRVRMAAERFNAAPTDPTVAATVTAEVTDALALAPSYAELQSFGKTVLTAATKVAPAPTDERRGLTPPKDTPSPTTWQLLDGDSVQIRFVGDAEFATAVRKKSDELRQSIPSRWSGPATGAWQPKCEIVLHPTAAAFAEATKQPDTATGHALIRFQNGTVCERRIDLRCDDPTLLDDALPRELTHVVLADLFPAVAPPRWAAEGMAVLAMSPTAVERYLRTEARLRQSNGVMAAGELLGQTGPPTADRVTAFSVASVSLVEFLVKWKGERAFTTFVRDLGRYGVDSAVKRQYAAADARQLDQLWRKHVGK